ncbi:MAG: AAA family ATPase [Bacteriovoracales bacterium]|nr:AAA family ATPase [Bacteriovoracales bacterium]
MIDLTKEQSFFLFGPRNSGKSTLLKTHFKELQTKGDILWIDLLDAQIQYQLSQRPSLLMDMWDAKKPPWIVIDEIQKNPKLLDIVHKMMEETSAKFALSGSSARKLKRGHANLLGGRALPFYLFPFSFMELEKKFNLDRALKFGLLPRFWASPMSDKDTVRGLYAYVDTYLKEEIASEQIVRKLDPFQRFLSVSAQSNGNIINFSKIERDAGLGASQAQKHFQILSDTLLGAFLPPYHSSIRKRQERKSKFYFFDTGVLRALQMMAQESLHPSTFEYGNLFETFIINEVLKMTAYLEKKWKLSYLKTQAGVEIDLIVEKPRTAPILIEIKSSLDIKEEHLKTLKRLASDFPKSTRYVWYRGPESYRIDQIQCLPWHQGIKELFEINS